jgi:hypothetical protein
MAHARGILVQVLLLGDLQWKPFVKRMSPFTEVFGWDQIDGIVWPEVNVVFSAYDLSGKSAPLWTYITNHAILVKAAHKVPPGFAHQKLMLQHTSCGGASNGM